VHVAQTARVKGFVDRRSELDLLQQCFQAAVDGTGALILAVGESGSGKSRLLREFCDSFSGRPVRCAVGQCHEYVHAPFAPIVEVLTSLSEADPSVLRGAPDLRATLANLMPEMREERTGAQPETDKLLQLNALTAALQRFGNERPAIIILEDLHWADSATLELLQFLNPRMAASRVLIAATLRAEELTRSHPLRSVIAKLEREPTTRRIQLAPLSLADVHELVFHAAPESESLPPRTIGAICAQAEGNPLYAEELLKTVIKSGSARTERRMPATLREAVLERYTALDDDERTILTHAAAFGRRFRAELLVQIADRPIEAIISALKRAIALSLVVEESNGDVRFAFKHELTRQAIYDELLATEARLLHKKIAVALEAATAGDHTVELAYHWRAAHEHQKAARYNGLAADRALSVFAYRDALDNLDRALAEETDEARRAALNLRLAHVLDQCGLDERAKRATESALEYFENAGDRERAAETCLELATRHAAYGDALKALGLTKHALELVGERTNSPSYFNAHVAMMRLYADYRWDPEKLREHQRLAERDGGERATRDRVSALLPLQIYLVGSGQPDEAVEVTRDTAAAAMNEAFPHGAIRCWAALAVDMTQAGEHAFAHDGFDRASALVREHGVGGLTAVWIRATSAYAKLLEGDLVTAKALVTDGLAADIETPAFRLLLARAGLPTGLALEDEVLVKRCARKDLADFAVRSSVVWMIGVLAAFADERAASGKPEDAVALLTSAIDSLDRMEALPAYGDADELFVAVASFGAAADIPRARAYLERTATTSRVRSTPAHLALFDAYVAARSGDAPRAATKAQEAVAAFRDIGRPHFEAQALELEGKEEAALEIYRRIGDVRDARRLDAKLNPVNRRGRSKGELTARESEICEQLIKGKSNKAIAEELVLSDRTVESHVSSILTKMNVTSRAELIAKLKAPS
jgi:DNA-binding CsgD family transcriptional regulator